MLAAAVFGIATALMNTFFFMGLARTDLGKSVAIEFIGPIAVAAAMTRTARNAEALLLAASGVVVLGGLEVGDNTIGLLLILAASAMWALYIVIGSRIAQLRRCVAGLGIGLAIGAVAITPIGAPGSAHVFTTPRLLVGCVLVGVFSNAIGYGIDQHVLRRIPVRRFSVLLALLPVTAVVFGWIGLDQVPSPVEFAGMALVLAGVVLQERDEIPHPARERSPLTHAHADSVQIRTTVGMMNRRGFSDRPPWIPEAVEVADLDAVAVGVGRRVVGVGLKVERAHGHVRRVDRQVRPINGSPMREELIASNAWIDPTIPGRRRARRLCAARGQLGRRRLGTMSRRRPGSGWNPLTMPSKRKIGPWTTGIPS